jgi:multicomponent Na+:H+ antiporter subunit B
LVLFGLVAAGGTVVVCTSDPKRQAVTLAVYGVLLSVLFLALAAPDVALSQVAVGSAVVPLMVLLAVRTRSFRVGPETMSRTARYVVFGVGAAVLALVLGAVTLLRPGKDEQQRRRLPDAGRMLHGTRLAGYVLLPASLILGADVVVHGHLTPGGGFQGGVILATGLHLSYVAGSYPALRRLRPQRWYGYGEAIGMGGVVALGVAGVLAGAGFLANVLPTGTFGQLVSAGTVPLFSVAIGIEVASGVVVLLAGFLEQDLAIATKRGSR